MLIANEKANGSTKRVAMSSPAVARLATINYRRHGIWNYYHASTVEGHSPTNMDDNPHSSSISSPRLQQMEVDDSECLRGNEIVAPFGLQWSLRCESIQTYMNIINASRSGINRSRINEDERIKTTLPSLPLS